ncbi:MAG: hypothetical protein AB7S48_01965 [Bacteroidales bacterium]
MASTSETGHAKNVANFEKLVIETAAFGENFNPSKAALKPAALNTLLDTAKAAIAAVNSAEPAYKNAVSTRDSAFSPFGKLITRVNNAIKASDTTVQEDESVRTIIRKLQGRRASAKKQRPRRVPLLPRGTKLSKFHPRR